MGKEITLHKVETMLNELSVPDLIYLNRIIVDRIRYLQKVNSLVEMEKFRIGETVSFNNNGRFITGKIIKFNQKTISVLTDDDHQWNVSPQLLMKKAY